MYKKCILTALLAVLLFTASSVLVLSGAFSPIEGWLYAQMTALMNPPLTMFMTGITRLCDPLTMAAACLLLLAIPPTRRAVALPVSITAGGTSLLNNGLKHIFTRERPTILWLIEESGYSFPSGHSATSAALGTLLLFYTLRNVDTPRRKRWLAVLCCMLPVCIGLSRVYLGVHYAGDVLAGWLLGVAAGSLVAAVAWRQPGELHEKSAIPVLPD